MTNSMGNDAAAALVGSRSAVEAIAALAQMLARGRLAVLFGAGLSKDSGLPLAGELVERVLATAGASESEQAVVRDSGLPFEAFMEGVAQHSLIQHIWKIFEQGSPYRNHQFLAKLMLRGELQQAYTTNFDQLLELAFAREGGELAVIREFVDSRTSPSMHRSPVLVKLHGCVADYGSMSLSMQQVASKAMAKSRESAVTTLFASGAHEAVLLIGYSASDAFDILPMIRLLEEPKPIVWVQHTALGIEVSPLKRDDRRFGSKMSGIILRCLTGHLVSELAKLLDISLSEHSIDPPRWCLQVAEWGKQSGVTFGPYFGEAVLGRALVDAMRPDVALSHWQKAASALPSSPSSVSDGVILRGLGSTLGHCGARREAHDRLVQALGVFRARVDRREESRCLCDIGQNHADAGQFQPALRAFRDGFKVAEFIGDLSLMARHSNGAGGCHGSLNEFGDAMFWLDNAIRYAEAIGDKTAEGIARVNVSAAYRATGDRKSAQALYEKGLSILDAAVGSENALVRAATRLRPES